MCMYLYNLHISQNHCLDGDWLVVCEAGRSNCDYNTRVWKNRVKSKKTQDMIQVQYL